MTYASLGECGTSGENTQWRLALDAIATSEPQGGGYRELYLLSAVGPQTSIKGVTAMIQTGKCSVWYQTPGSITKHASAYGESGFKIYRHRLAFDHWQMLAVSCSTALLPSMSRREIWRRLSGPGFTTPLLRGWVPWIASTLKQCKRIQNLDCHRCSAGLMFADSDVIDRIVQRGIVQGDLRFDATVDGPMEEV